MTTPPYASRQELFASFAAHVSPGKVRAYQKYGLEAVMGARAGASFADAYDDRRWVNCHCNGGVFNLGHRNPAVLAAVMSALERCDVGNHHLVSAPRAQLAERLSATTQGALSGVVFGVSGGEAIDLALKLVRGVSGRQKIVSANGGYHGHTGLALAAGDPQYREPFGPNLPGFVQVPFDDVDAMDRAIDADTAAVILEPIPATLGMPIARPGYLRSVQELCRARGARLMMDEVQTGLGRTGAIWCHQLDGLDPDVVVTGKGLSGGIYPITATLVRGDLLDFFTEHPFIHISTFGGAEPGCAAALAVLDIIEAPGFLERVDALARRFAEGFEGLRFTLRQRGLMMGFALPVPDAGLMAAKMLYDAGVFCTWANNDTSVLQFLPPLVLSDEDADAVIAIVRGIFS